MQVVPALMSGESVALSFDWIVPLDPAAPHTLQVEVDPLNELVEIMETNNTQSLVELLPDLTVGNVNVITTADTMTITATIFNQGSSPTLMPFAAALRLDDAVIGDSAASTTLTDSLAAGESVEVLFTIDDPFSTFAAVHVSYLVVDTGNTIVEADENNNDNFAAINPFLSWKNPLDPLDVNRDTHVSPVDVLILINELNARGSQLLAILPTPPFFLDANGDDFISPIDPLLIINFLNSLGGPEGEPTAARNAVFAGFAARNASIDKAPVKPVRRQTALQQLPTAETGDKHLLRRRVHTTYRLGTEAAAGDAVLLDELFPGA